MNKNIKKLLTFSASLLMFLGVNASIRNINASSIYGNWQHNITRRTGKYVPDNLKPYHKYTSYDELNIKPGKLTWITKPINQGWSSEFFRLRYRRGTYYAKSPDFQPVYLRLSGKNALRVKGLSFSKYYRIIPRRKRYYRPRRRIRSRRPVRRYQRRNSHRTSRRRPQTTHRYHIVVGGIDDGWTNNKQAYEANTRALQRAVVLHDYNQLLMQKPNIYQKQQKAEINTLTKFQLRSPYYNNYLIGYYGNLAKAHPSNKKDLLLYADAVNGYWA